MTTLVLGVIDQLYVTPPPAITPGTRAKKSSVHQSFHGQYGAVSTGDVAQILEDKYHVMLVFFFAKETPITQLLCNEVGKTIKSISQGAPIPNNMYDGAMSRIQGMFKTFLSMSEIEGLGVPGVPTQAALDGVSHRFKGGLNWIRVKQPNGKFKKVYGVRRPSFIDTGLYQANAKAWAE